MRDTIHMLRHFGPYLLPASLLATAGVLLMALLRYPVPSAPPSRVSHATGVADHDHGRSPAETLFAAMVADALRQRWEERPDGHARTLEYRYERLLPLEERPTLPPPWPDGGVADRPLLIQL